MGPLFLFTEELLAEVGSSRPAAPPWFHRSTLKSEDRRRSLLKHTTPATACSSSYIFHVACERD
jgi:hypothetical protein